MAEQSENLEELLSRFYDDKTVGEFTDDLRQAESLLEENPAPEPKPGLLADIKMKVETAVLVKKSRFYRSSRYKVAAMAAGFIILAAMSVKFFRQRIEPAQTAKSPVVAEFVWDNGSENLETLTAEIEELESDMLAFEFAEVAENGSYDIDEFEIEVLESGNDFWKG